jgi:hypothetical protein
MPNVESDPREFWQQFLSLSETAKREKCSHLLASYIKIGAPELAYTCSVWQVRLEAYCKWGFTEQALKDAHPTIRQEALKAGLDS